MQSDDLNNFVEVLRGQYLKAFDAILALIDHCPDEMWTESHGGFPMAQQLLHPILDSIYYLRHDNRPPERLETIVARLDVLQPNLDRPATETLSKDEIRALAGEHRPEIEEWFDTLADCGLEESATDEGETKLRTTLMNLRHLAYHGGHADAAFHERNMKAPGWGYMS